MHVHESEEKKCKIRDNASEGEGNKSYRDRKNGLFTKKKSEVQQRGTEVLSFRKEESGDQIEVKKRKGGKYSKEVSVQKLRLRQVGSGFYRKP